MLVVGLFVGYAEGDQANRERNNAYGRGRQEGETGRKDDQTGCL